MPASTDQVEMSGAAFVQLRCSGEGVAGGTFIPGPSLAVLVRRFPRRPSNGGAQRASSSAALLRPRF